MFCSHSILISSRMDLHQVLQLQGENRGLEQRSGSRVTRLGAKRSCLLGTILVLQDRSGALQHSTVGVGNVSDCIRLFFQCTLSTKMKQKRAFMCFCCCTQRPEVLHRCLLLRSTLVFGTGCLVDPGVLNHSSQTDWPAFPRGPLVSASPLPEFQVLAALLTFLLSVGDCTSTLPTEPLSQPPKTIFHGMNDSISSSLLLWAVFMKQRTQRSSCGAGISNCSKDYSCYYFVSVVLKVFGYKHSLVLKAS